MKKMLIDAAEKVVRVAIIKDNELIDYESEKIVNEQLKVMSI